MPEKSIQSITNPTFTPAEVTEGYPSNKAIDPTSNSVSKWIPFFCTLSARTSRAPISATEVEGRINDATEKIHVCIFYDSAENRTSTGRKHAGRLASTTMRMITPPPVVDRSKSDVNPSV